MENSSWVLTLTNSSGICLNTQLLDQLPMIKFAFSFNHQLLSSNQYIFEFIPTLFPTLLDSFGAKLMLIAWVAAVTVNHFVRNYYKSTKYAYIIAILIEIGVILLLFAPALFPYKVSRFVFGLLMFETAMIIHSNLCIKLQQNEETNTSNIPLPSPMENPGKNVLLSPRSNNTNDGIYGNNDLFTSYMETLLFIRRKHLYVQSKPYLSWKCIIYIIYTGLIVDLIIYLCREYIPHNVIPAHQYLASSLLGGLIVLYGIDLSYSIMILFSKLFGKSLPYIYRHRHPLLSSSLSELWGVRWNPIIMKTLQDAFYIPLKKLNCSRTFSMLGCFIGSALLHAYPAYMANWNIYECWIMNSFFLLHGIMTTIENILINITGFRKYFDANLMIQSGDHETKSRFQWLIESTLCTAFSMVVFNLVTTTDILFEQYKFYIMIFCIILAILLFAIQTYYMLLSHPIHQYKSYHVRLILICCKTVGWIYTIIAMVTFLPYFTIPVLNAFDTYNPKSYIIGPFIRSLYEVHTTNNDSSGSGNSTLSLNALTSRICT